MAVVVLENYYWLLDRPVSHLPTSNGNLWSEGYLV